MDNKFLIVDGSNLLFQMFFGMPSRIINHQGKAIQGTLGFVGALLKIIRQVNPNRILVIFDGECENARRELDEDYKANRPDYRQIPDTDNPFSQINDIFCALNYLGIKYLETINCEADDLIASYTKTYGNDNELYVLSYDSDFFQLITSKVSVIRYKGDHSQYCTPDYIKDKYDILPEQYAFFKALVGDKADNIKGVPQVGVKTAAKLLHMFSSLDDLMRKIDQVADHKLRDALQTNFHRLQLNEKLIYLTGNVSLPFLVDELRYQYNGVTTNEVLINIGLKAAS